MRVARQWDLLRSLRLAQDDIDAALSAARLIRGCHPDLSKDTIVGVLLSAATLLSALNDKPSEEELLLVAVAHNIYLNTLVRP